MNVLPASIQMKIMKKDKEEEDFWPRLLENKVLEKTNVTVDWDKYVDEDEGDQDFDTGALDGGMDFASMMQGMGGAGGMPGRGGRPGMGGMGGMPDMSAMMGGMGAGGMPDMGGAGDMGMDEAADSDDDEELPDLEPSA